MRGLFFITGLLVIAAVAEAQQPKLVLPIGHTGAVYSASFSPDGKKIVTASADNTAKIWDTQTGVLLADLKGHTETVTSACFSPDGKKIVTTAADGTTKIWDARSGAILSDIKEQIDVENHIIHAYFSPDGKKIVAASVQEAKIWDAQSGVLLVYLKGLTEGLNSSSFSPDGKKIITVTERGTANIWDTQSGSLLTDGERSANSVYQAYFSPDGKKIVTASGYNYYSGKNSLWINTVKIWDAQNWAYLAVLKGHSSRINSICFSSDGNKIVTASGDSTAKVWDAQSGAQLAAWKHDWEVTSAFFFPGNKKIVTTSLHDTAKIWDIISGQLIANLAGHTGYITRSSFSADGKRIVTGSWDNTASVWETGNGMVLTVLKGHTHGVAGASFSPDGKKIVTAGNTVTIWDAANGLLLAGLKGHTDWVASASFSPACPDDPVGGKKMVTASYDNTAKIWNTQNGELLNDLKGHTGAVNSASFSPDGKKIVTISGDHTTKIWDAQNGKMLADLKGEARSACFSPDGRKLITGSVYSTKIWDASTGVLLTDLKGTFENVFGSLSISPDGKKMVKTGPLVDTIGIWDAKTGLLLVTLKGNRKGLTGASFSPDSKKFVTTSGDHLAAIWDAENGTLLTDLNGHSDVVNSALFSADGKKIITASQDSTVKIWDAQGGTILADFNDHNGGVSNAYFSPDGNKIISLSGTAKIWDANSRTLLAELKRFDENIEGISFFPDGREILTASWRSAKIWDAETGALLADSKGGVSPNGKKWVRAMADGTAAIWDVPSGQMLTVLTGGSNTFRSASFSPDGAKIITTSWDNTTKIWDADTGGILYTFFAVDSSDYLVVDKDNHYDGSSNARKLLYFSCGTEVIGLDQVKDSLWVPNLAERIMKREAIHAPKLADLDICGLTPEVEDIGENEVYKFKITPGRGGLGETVLFINNNETKRYAPGQLKKTAAGYELAIPKEVLQSYLVAGKQNPVTVRCYTAKNDIVSRGVVIIADETKKEAIVPRLYAVVVGVSDYKAKELLLNYAAKDAQDIGNAISIAAGKLLNTDGLEHVFLYNFNTGQERYSYPDKKSIRQIFDTIAKKATANDILLVFFAGHGTVAADQDNKKQFYFLTADASSFTDPAASGISTKELISWIQPSNIKAQKRILILDACSSGQAINDISGNKELMAVRSTDAGDEKKEIERLNDQSGMFILAASASTQSAYEFGRYAQGLLTYTLLKAIKQQPDILEENKYLNLSRWFSAAKRSVNDIMRQSGNTGRQEPQLVANTNFNIGIVDAEVVSKIKLADEKPMFARSDFRKAGLRSDELKLRQLVDKELNTISSRGSGNGIIYRGDYEGSDAYWLSGDYTVEGNQVMVSVSLLKGGTELKQYELKGTMENIQQLALEIVKKAVEEAGKNK